VLIPLCFFTQKIRDWQVFKKGYLAILSFVLLYFVLRNSILNIPVGISGNFTGGILLNFVNYFRGMAHLAWVFLFPVGLHLSRSIPYETSLLNAHAVLSVFFIAMFFIFMIWVYKLGMRKIWFAFGWFICALLFIFQTMHMYNAFFPRGYLRIVISEQWTYLPLVGLSLIIAAFFLWLGKRTRMLSRAFFLVLVVFFMGMNINAHAQWQNNISLFSNALKFEPTNMSLQYALGCAYVNTNKPGQAINIFSNILRLRLAQDKVSKFTSRVYLGFGVACYQLGNFNKALSSYIEAVTIDSANYLAWDCMGIILLIKGKNVLAKKAFNESLALNSNFPGAFEGLGVVAMAEKNFKTAVAYFNRASSLDPDNPAFWIRLSDAYRQLGEFQLSVEAKNKAAQIKKSGQTSNELALGLM